jgi:phosphoribosyl 1,2-cyclic phosphodiesterase
VPVLFTVLGSGSGGNSAYLEWGETRLLVDAGLSGRQVRQRLAQIGRTPETLSGILITHEHSDHIQGLNTLGLKLRIPIFCNRLTRDEIQARFEAPMDFRIFATGSTFEVGGVGVETFSVPHDAQDPVGFMLRTSKIAVGIVTDLGHATRLVLERIRHANLLVFETNHDVQMLQDNPHRPWSLKQRILSRHGHLSNEAAAEAMEQIVSAELEHLYLGHISRECNRPEIAHRVLRERLDNIGASHVRITVTDQYVPTAQVALDKA